MIRLVALVPSFCLIVVQTVSHAALSHRPVLSPAKHLLFHVKERSTFTSVCVGVPAGDTVLYAVRLTKLKVDVTELAAIAT